MALFLFLFLAALMSAVAVDVRDMSIDEYINFVNPPSVHKYQNKLGDSILCVMFSDQISVKYAHDNITRGLEKPPKLKSSRLNISGFNFGGENVSNVGLKSECPEDTVVIREIKREDVERAGSVRQFLNGRRRRNNIAANEKPTNPINGGAHEYAYVGFKSDDDPVTAISAYLNVWSPYVAPDGYFSVSQIWAINEAQDGPTVNTQTIEVGWTVFPGRYGDSQPRLFVYWTNNSYNSGCYDLDCPGFVLVPGHTSPGAHVQPLSAYGGTQYEILVTLQNLEVTENEGVVWTLLVQNQLIGYWPTSLFSILGRGATVVDIGGAVGYSTRPRGTGLTKTQMGNGHFPQRGFGRAAYTRIKDITTRSWADIRIPVETHETKPKCYGAIYNRGERKLFFGGVGGQNPNCVA